MSYKVVLSWKRRGGRAIGEGLHGELCYYLGNRLNAVVNSEKCTAEINTESPEEVGAIFLELEDLVGLSLSYKISPV